MNFLLLLAIISGPVMADQFREEAPRVADSLKKNLMGNLGYELKDKGAAKAVDFCHLEVKNLASKTEAEFKGKYEFGRTSHKIRNPQNAPQKWMESYIEDFKNKKQTDPKAAPFIHTQKNGKRVYVEPLWIAPMCLQCHGEHVAKNVEAEILKRYPKDQARNFRVGDFRGFIWIKEK